jgi:CRP-like cAMP-binding protein
VKADPSPTPAKGSFARLAALARLSGEDLQALERAAHSRSRFHAQREIVSENAPALPPSIVLEGWACRVREFPDGRRQILGFLLPGELIGGRHHGQPLATTTIMALTPVTLCPAPAREHGEDGLAKAYAVSSALEESYLYRHIARLGRMSAYERLADWILEIRERLALAELVTANAFPMPLTQEALADTLGLTSVHVNRTLQLMRREGLVEIRSGTARLIEPAHLEAMVDYRPARAGDLRAG